MSPRNKGTDKTRFTFWLPEDTHAELAELQRKTGKESVAEVIREAIRVYQDLLKANDAGVDLFFEERKTGKTGRIWLLPGHFPVSPKEK
jgi:predicted transcriptional regulator